MKARGAYRYSRKIPGTRGNCGWAVRFDLSQGFLGISQYTDKTETNVKRVLLSAGQLKALIKFVGQGERG